MIFERGNGIYCGQWQKGRYHGYGKYEYFDGTTYEGSWNQGFMHGQGKFTWPKSLGAVFLGEFKNDKRYRGTIFD